MRVPSRLTQGPRGAGRGRGSSQWRWLRALQRIRGRGCPTATHCTDTPSPRVTVASLGSMRNSGGAAHTQRNLWSTTLRTLRPWFQYTQKNIFRNLMKSNWIQIVFIIFRLILVQFNKIQKRWFFEVRDIPGISLWGINWEMNWYHNQNLVVVTKNSNSYELTAFWPNPIVLHFFYPLGLG